MDKKGNNHVPEPSGALLEIYEEVSNTRGPPQATLAKRAKSYSDFYDVAVGYLGKKTLSDQISDSFDALERASDSTLNGDVFEDLEDELLDESHDEYRYARFSQTCQSLR